MRGWHPLASIGLAMALLGFANVATADPVAFVVAIEGRVTVTAAGTSVAQKAVLGRPLERGDKVAVGRGSSANIFFSDGNIIELAERSSLTIGGRLAGGSKLAPGSGVSGEVFGRVSKFVTGGSGASGLVALAPMRGEHEDSSFLLSPRRTDLLMTTPVFTWKPVEGATRYQVTVFGDEGRLWARETRETTLEFPADVKPLVAGGEYAWEVKAFGETGHVRREESVFRVLPEAEAALVADHLKQIEQAAGATRAAAGYYLAGSYLFGHGLYRDAAERFQALCELTPDAAGAYEALGTAYRVMGLDDLAAERFRKALELSKAR